MYIFRTSKGEYKCHLSVESTVQLERKLKKNPLMIFEEDKVPPITVMISVLHAAMQDYNHNITEEKAMKIFSQWIADGNTVVEFLKVLTDIFKDGGFLKSDNDDDEEDGFDEDEEEAKN